jgi:hypothetical protein
MYETWGKKVIHQHDDSLGIYSQVCASSPTFYNCPKTIITLNTFSSTDQQHLLVRFVDFPIP